MIDMAPLVEDFEGGSDGVEITTSNAGFGFTDRTPRFTSEQAHGGSLSATADAGMGESYLWYPAPGLEDTFDTASGCAWFRINLDVRVPLFEVYANSFPPETPDAIHNLAFAFGLDSGMYLDSAFVGGGRQMLYTDMTPFLNAWFRVDWEWQVGGTFQITVNTPDFGDSMTVSAEQTPLAYQWYKFTKFYLYNYAVYDDIQVWMDDVGIPGELIGSEISGSLDLNRVRFARRKRR